MTGLDWITWAQLFVLHPVTQVDDHVVYILLYYLISRQDKPYLKHRGLTNEVSYSSALLKILLIPVLKYTIKDTVQFRILTENIPSLKTSQE